MKLLKIHKCDMVVNLFKPSLYYFIEKKEGIQLSVKYAHRTHVVYSLPSSKLRLQLSFREWCSAEHGKHFVS